MHRRGIGPRLPAYLGGIIRSLEGVALTIGGIEDHVHILASFWPQTPPTDAIGKIKANSSGWVHEEFPARHEFAWQVGYGVFSLSRSKLEQAKRYIENRKEHHRTMTFEEEFIALLKRHGIEYDGRFVFD